MAIPTYSQNPEAGQLGGTAKVSTSGSPVAQALQGLGGSIQNVGQVMNQFAQAKKAKNNEADYINLQTDYNEQIASKETDILSRIRTNTLSEENGLKELDEFKTAYAEKNITGALDKDVASSFGNYAIRMTSQSKIGISTGAAKIAVDRNLTAWSKEQFFAQDARHGYELAEDWSVPQELASHNPDGGKSYPAGSVISGATLNMYAALKKADTDPSYGDNAIQDIQEFGRKAETTRISGLIQNDLEKAKAEYKPENHTDFQNQSIMMKMEAAEQKVFRMSTVQQSQNFSKLETQAYGGGLTIGEIEIAENTGNTVNGVYFPNISQEQSVALKTIVQGKSNSEVTGPMYIANQKKLADLALKEGANTDRAILDEAMKTLVIKPTGSSVPRAAYSAQTTSLVLRNIKTLFQPGKLYDPGFWSAKFKTTATHSKAVNELSDWTLSAIELARKSGDTTDYLRSYNAGMSALLDVFDEKGTKVTDADLSDWRQTYIAPIIGKITEEDIRNTYAPEPTNGVVKEPWIDL